MSEAVHGEIYKKLMAKNYHKIESTHPKYGEILLETVTAYNHEVISVPNFAPNFVKKLHQ